MYNRFKQSISVAMALLVLISTLSVSIEKHYCGDHLVDIAFFAEAEKCGMEGDDQGSDLMANSCCKDVLDLVEGQDELSVEKTQVLNADQKIFILSFAAVFSGLNILEPQKHIPFEHYSPPNYVRDIQVLNEVFLI